MTLHPARRPARRDDPALPLINLALLLMVFFLLVGSLGATPPRALQLPRGAATEAAAPGTHGLWLDACNRAWLDGYALNDETLPAQARRWTQAHPQARLAVRADARADAQHLLRVLEALRAAGVAHAELLSAPEAP